MGSTWVSLVVVSVIALLSTALGLILYRYSSAVVQKQTVRITGATAIAWVFFLGMGRLYITVSQDLQAQTQQQCDSQQAALLSFGESAQRETRSYKECALLTGEFECKGPADRMAKACNELVEGLQ